MGFPAFDLVGESLESRYSVGILSCRITVFAVQGVLDFFLPCK